MALWGIPSFILKAGTEEAVGRMLLSNLEKIMSGFGDRMKERIKSQPGAEVLQVLVTMDPDYLESLEVVWSDYMATVGTKENDKWVADIAKALPRKDDGSLDLEMAKKVLDFYARLDPTGRQGVIELLRTDDFARTVRHYWQRGYTWAQSLSYGIAYVLSESDEMAAEWVRNAKRREKARNRLRSRRKFRWCKGRRKAGFIRALLGD